MGRQVMRAASAKLWSVPQPPGTAQTSPLTKKEQSAYFPLNFTGCWTGFEDFAGIRHSESILTGSACNFGGKGKGGEILEVHRLNKKSLQDHLTLWPKLMAKLEYVIPSLQPHSTATAQLPGSPAHTPIRSAEGRASRESHRCGYGIFHVYIKSPPFLTKTQPKTSHRKGVCPGAPPAAWPQGVGWQCWKQITGHVIFLFLPLRRLFTAPHSHSKHVERIFPRHISLSELSSWIPL